MTTFFSGTDTSNLHESAEFFNYYLSLIVNHSGDYCAKISMGGKTEDKVSSVRYYKNKKGELYSKIVTTEANEDCIFIYDCDITIDKGSVTDANATQIAKLKAAKTTYTTPYNYYNFHTKTWEDKPKNDFGSNKFVKNKGEHIARLSQHKPHSLEGTPTVKGLSEDWDDYDFSTLGKKEKQLTIFPPKDGPEENYLEEIIEKICGKKITDIEFDAYLQGTAIQGHRAEYLTEAEEAITENMQYLYDVKQSALQQERTNLIIDLRKKLTYHSYQAPQEFFELIKEAFDNEFKYNA